MRSALVAVCWGAMVAALVAGCGGDDEESGSGPSGASGSAGTPGSSGSGGSATGGDAGSPGSGGSGGDATGGTAGTSETGGSAGSAETGGTAGAAGSEQTAGMAGMPGGGAPGGGGAPNIATNTVIIDGNEETVTVACVDMGAVLGYGVQATMSAGTLSATIGGDGSRPTASGTYTLDPIGQNMDSNTAMVTRNDGVTPYYSQSGTISTIVDGDDFSVIIDGLTLHDHPVTTTGSTISVSANLSCPKERFNDITITRSGGGVDTCQAVWTDCMEIVNYSMSAAPPAGCGGVNTQWGFNFAAGGPPADGSYDLVGMGAIGATQAQMMLLEGGATYWWSSNGGSVTVSRPAADELMATYTDVVLAQNGGETVTVTGTQYCRLP